MKTSEEQQNKKLDLVKDDQQVYQHPTDQSKVQKLLIEQVPYVRLQSMPQSNISRQHNEEEMTLRQKFQNQSQEILFSYDKAVHIVSKLGEQGLISYFKRKIEKKIDTATMSQCTKNNYLNGLKKFYLHIFKLNKSTFCESDVVHYVKAQKNQAEQRSMLQKLLNSYDIKFQKKKKELKEEKLDLKKSVVLTFKVFDNYINIYRQDLICEKQEEMALLIDIVTFLDIKITLIPYLTYVALLGHQTELTVEENQVQKKVVLKIPIILMEKCENYLNSHNNTNRDSYICKGRSRREINQWFTDVKNTVISSLQQEQEDYKFFISNLTLKQIKDIKKKKSEYLHSLISHQQNQFLERFQLVQTNNIELFTEIQWNHKRFGNEYQNFNNRICNIFLFIFIVRNLKANLELTSSKDNQLIVAHDNSMLINQSFQNLTLENQQKAVNQIQQENHELVQQQLEDIHKKIPSDCDI